MTGLDDVLNGWLKDVESAQKLSIAEQAKITKAGADVLQKKIADETKSKHYSKKKRPVNGHMADSVIVLNTDVDGAKTGVSTVGFDKYHAGNARRLNDGTKRIKADHFIDNARDSATDAVMDAESKTYREILKQKGLT